MPPTAAVFSQQSGGSAGGVRPLLNVQRTGDKLTDQKCRGEIAVHHKADIFLFVAYESAADIVAGVPEIDVYIISHFPCNFKRVLNEYLTN